MKLSAQVLAVSPLTVESGPRFVRAVGQRGASSSQTASEGPNEAKAL